MLVPSSVTYSLSTYILFTAQFLTTITLLISLFCLSQQAALKAQPDIQTTTNGGPHCHPWVFVMAPPVNHNGRIDITNAIVNGGTIRNRAFVESGRPAITFTLRSVIPPTEPGTMQSRHRVVTIDFESQYFRGYDVSMERFYMLESILWARPNSVRDVHVPAAEPSPFGISENGRITACFSLQDAAIHRWALQVRGPTDSSEASSSEP